MSGGCGWQCPSWSSPRLPLGMAASCIHLSLGHWACIPKGSRTQPSQEAVGSFPRKWGPRKEQGTQSPPQPGNAAWEGLRPSRAEDASGAISLLLRGRSCEPSSGQGPETQSNGADPETLHKQAEGPSCTAPAMEVGDGGFPQQLAYRALLSWASPGGWKSLEGDVYTCKGHKSH